MTYVGSSCSIGGRKPLVATCRANTCNEEEKGESGVQEEGGLTHLGLQWPSYPALNCASLASATARDSLTPLACMRNPLSTLLACAVSATTHLHPPPTRVSSPPLT